MKFTGKPLDITLQEDTQTLDEVVVTALGIKRQKRSLGYSTTTVGGKDFTEARTTNIGNALSARLPVFPFPEMQLARVVVAVS